MDLKFQMKPRRAYANLNLNLTLKITRLKDLASQIQVIYYERVPSIGFHCSRSPIMLLPNQRGLYYLTLNSDCKLIGPIHPRGLLRMRLRQP
jgi:hypothetical protein